MTAACWHVTVRCPARDTDLVAAHVVAATGHGVEEPAPGLLNTVLESERGARDLVNALATQFEGLEATVEECPAVDWAVHWRDGISSRRFGRLILTPSWLPVTPSAGEVVVTVDPESAFGSGEHGSTRAALSLLERHLVRGHRVLDFGSGSGILAIAAARLGAAAAVGIEIDEATQPIAEANALRNGVADHVTFLLGDAGQLHALVGPADLVCSNILRTVNADLLPAIRDALRPGGLAIFSGMELSEATLFRPLLIEEGWTVREEIRDDDWWAVAAERPA